MALPLVCGLMQIMCYSKFIKSIATATAWYIWKARCNAIFKNEVHDFNSIPRKAYALAQEYSAASNPQRGKNLILADFSYAEGPFLFSATFCSRDMLMGGAGFYIVGSNYVISLAGCCPIANSSELDTKIKALLLSLQCVALQGINLQHIFIA